MVTSDPDERLELVLGFDSLGDGNQPQCVAQRHDRLGDRCIARFGAQTLRAETADLSNLTPACCAQSLRALPPKKALFDAQLRSSSR